MKDISAAAKLSALEVSGDVGDMPLLKTVAFLRVLSMVHQNHHWAAFSPTQMSDHLLFERLYNETQEEIDALGEKAFLYGESYMDESITFENIQDMWSLLVKTQMGKTVDSPNALVENSLVAELLFAEFLDGLVLGLQASGRMGDGKGRGLDKIIQDMQDTHEGHVYLLRQRLKG